MSSSLQSKLAIVFSYKWGNKHSILLVLAGGRRELAKRLSIHVPEFPFEAWFKKKKIR